MANAIMVIIVVCVVIRILASGGTMRHTTPADLETARQRAVVARARQSALRAQRASQSNKT
jgi:hypothetical protein